MRINILIEDSKVAQARQNMGYDNILKIPVSTTGQMPATHWFCTMAGEEEKMNSILAKQNLSIMESNIGPKEFLEKWNLKVIR